MASENQGNEQVEPKWTNEWIANDDDLERVSEKIRNEDIISLDTETAGWQTGNEKLCLIQIGIPSEEHTLLIDPLEFDSLKPLEPALSKKSPELVAHNAAFEERQFARDGIKLKGIIDTLTMSRELRPDLPNHTLQTCCKLILGISLSKEEQTSDWSLRPLNENQLKYASLDAEVAMYLYQALHQMEEQLEIDPAMEVPELMQALHQTVGDRVKLTQAIATDLALLNSREEMLREAIRSKLIEGSPAYNGDYGSCKVSKVKRTEIDPEAVREHLPSLVDEVIQEYVQRKHLRAVMKEHAVDESKLDLVTNIIGYTDRMSLSLKNPV